MTWPLRVSVFAVLLDRAYDLAFESKCLCCVLIALTVRGWYMLLMCQGSAQENRSAGVCNTLVHNCVLGEQEKEHFICHNKTHQFSSRWYLCAQKSPYMLHPISQKLPHVAFEMVPIFV